MVLLVAAVVWYVLNRTALGRHVYATGDDPDAARLAGISTDRMLLAVYALAGLICAHRRLGADRPHRLGSARRPARPPTSTRSPPW